MKNKSEFYQNLGFSINKLRTEKGLTLEQLIDIAGLEIDKSTLSIIEHGKQSISAYQLYLISNAFDIAIDKLFESQKLTIDNTSKITADEQNIIKNM